MVGWMELSNVCSVYGGWGTEEQEGEELKQSLEWLKHLQINCKLDDHVQTWHATVTPLLKKWAILLFLIHCHIHWKCPHHLLIRPLGRTLKKKMRKNKTEADIYSPGFINCESTQFCSYFVPLSTDVTLKLIALPLMICMLKCCVSTVGDFFSLRQKSYSPLHPSRFIKLSFHHVSHWKTIL